MTGAEFKAIRLSVHVTQADLGLFLGVRETTIHRWETDKTEIPKAVTMVMEQVKIKKHIW